jgi:GIY-YIG catalytic domain
MKPNDVRRLAEVDSGMPRRLRPGAAGQKTEMKKPSGDDWFVYILRCADGSFYTGITKDVKRRCQQRRGRHSGTDPHAILSSSEAGTFF